MKSLGVAGIVAVMVLAVAAGSRVPYAAPHGDDAVLRLSWRSTITAREQCRQRTAAELEALPVHMRTPEVCTRDEATYVLITQVGDERADTIALLRGGVKGDRPLFVRSERRLPPGEHRVYVSLERASASGRESLAAMDTVLELRAGHVLLVTTDADGRTLVVRSSLQ
jgi:hypothetical protein